MATTPSRPNPLHGNSKVSEKPPSSEVQMGGMPPQSNMAPTTAVDSPVGLADYTVAEQEAGKKALDTFGEQTKAEQEAGQRALTRGAKVVAPVTQSE